MVKSWGIEYIETSFKANINCNEAFEKLVALIASIKVKKQSHDLSVYIEFIKNIKYIYFYYLLGYKLKIEKKNYLYIKLYYLNKIIIIC